MTSRRLGRNPIYRREVRLGHPRHWWRCHTAQCLFLAVGIAVWSCLELVAGILGPAWGANEAAVTSKALLLLALMAGPLHLALSLRTDVRTKIAESVIAAGMSAEEYLRGKLHGALRPTFLLLATLWLRWVLSEVRFNTSFAQYASLGDNGLIFLHLAFGSIEFLGTALVWTVGIFCYATLAALLTLRWRSAWSAITVVTLIAALVELWIPAGLALSIRRSSVPIQDTVIGVVLVLAIISVVVKWMLSGYFFDRTEEQFGEWALE